MSKVTLPDWILAFVVHFLADDTTTRLTCSGILLIAAWTTFLVLELVKEAVDRKRAMTMMPALAIVFHWI